MLAGTLFFSAMSVFAKFAGERLPTMELVLARVVELVSGLSFDEFLEQRIVGPLGMRDTGFFVPPEKLDRFAACYDRGPGKVLRLQDDPEKSPYLESPRFLSGGGGLVSTAHDYLRFCRALLHGGELDGARIPSEAAGDTDVEIVRCEADGAEFVIETVVRD